MNTVREETLAVFGRRIAEAALTRVIWLCPEIRTASKETRASVCAAMRAKSREVAALLIDVDMGHPYTVEVLVTDMVMRLAEAGVKVMRP